MSRSDECAERVLAIIRPRYLVTLAVAGAVQCTLFSCIVGESCIKIYISPVLLMRVAWHTSDHTPSHCKILLKAKIFNKHIIYML